MSIKTEDVQVEELVRKYMNKVVNKGFEALQIDQDKIDNLPPEARKRVERQRQNDAVHIRFKSLFKIGRAHV